MDIRLRKERHFGLVYDKGKKIVGDRVVIYYLKNPQDHLEAPDAGPKAGFVASRKVGKAVQRNRAKRLMRAALTPLIARLRLSDIWFVLVARQAIVGCSFHEIHDEIQRNLEGEELVSPAESAD